MSSSPDCKRAVCTARAEVEGVRCRLSLQDAAGAGLWAEEFGLPAAPRTCEVDTGALALGQYELSAELLPAEGEVLARDVALVDLLPGESAGVFLRPDRVAVVNGQPWFPIGLTSISPLDDEAEGLAQAGFNLLVPGLFSQGERDAARALLDRAQQLGLYVMEWNNAWVYPPGQVLPEAREAALGRMAANAGDHPAFLGLMCDEALWNGVPPADVTHAYRTMRRLMPTRLFWQNQAPRNTIEDLARYCRAADVSGMDIYPVEEPSHSDLPNQTLSVVGDEVEKNLATVQSRKPVWAILQGFGWLAWEQDPALHRRAPTWEETRFMAYDAIVHGATGIIYWGASYEARDREIWQSLRRMAGELRDLTPALVAPEPVAVTAEPAGSPIVALGRRVDGRLWVIAVNESAAEVQATLPLPGTVGAVGRWAEEGEAPLRQQGRLTDEFAAWGVHVYRER